MKLKHKVETDPVYTVDGWDLQHYILEHFGHIYNFNESNEVGNGDTCRAVVGLDDDKYGTLRTEALQFIENHLEGSWCPMGIPLNALYLKGLIEPGIYLVSLSW